MGRTASPIRAMGAPILAGTPWSTRICSTPSASASRSNVALSDSTSASTSPCFTWSPLFFFHSTIVPSSIVSESFGMLISGIWFPSHCVADQALDVLAGGDRGLLEWQAVGHRDLGAAKPPDRCVEVVEAPLLHARCDLGGHSVSRPAFLDHDAPARLAHRVHDRRPVDGTDRAQVDHLRVDVLLFQLLRRLVGQHGHPRDADDRDIRAGAAQRRLAQRRGVVAGRHVPFDVVEAQRLEEHHRVVGADRRLEHSLRVLRSRRRDDEQTRDQAVEDLEAVGVLRGQLVARAAGHPDHHRHLDLAAEHVADLGRVVHDLVVGDQGEVDRHHLDHRPQPEHRRADRRADDDLFSDGCVDHALRAELVEQSLGDAVSATELADVLPDQVDRVVALHLLAECLAQREAVELLLGLDRRRHQTLSVRSSGRLSHCPAYVYLYRSSMLGSGLWSANSMTSRTSASTSWRTVLKCSSSASPLFSSSCSNATMGSAWRNFSLSSAERYLSGSTTEWPRNR